MGRASLLIVWGVLLVNGCRDRQSGEVTIIDTDGQVVQTQAATVESDHASPRDIAVSYADAVLGFARLTGREAGQVESMPTLRTFGFVDAPPDDEQVLAWQQRFGEQGAFVFRMTHGCGDVIAMLPTRDPREVIRMIGTASPANDLSNEALIAFMDQLDEPWNLVGCGYNFIAARIVPTPEQDMSLAVRLMELCPELVGKGYATVADLVIDLRRGHLLLIW